VLGVLGEPVGGVPRLPAAPVLQRLRRVPVVERGHGLDAALQQPVDDPAVEVEAALVGCAGAVGLDTGPGDGEPVRPQSQRAHQVEVFGVAVVVVDRDVTGVAVFGAARRVAERVPHRLTAAVVFRRPFDLVRRRRGPPPEAVRKRQAERSVDRWVPGQIVGLDAAEQGRSGRVSGRSSASGGPGRYGHVRVSSVVAHPPWSGSAPKANPDRGGWKWGDRVAMRPRARPHHPAGAVPARSGKGWAVRPGPSMRTVVGCMRRVMASRWRVGAERCRTEAGRGC
jgi:hypothetical protein